MKISFSVLGEPGSKGRPRFSRVGNYTKTYTPQKTESYENLVKLEYRVQCKDYKFPDDAQLDVRILAYFGIPKSKSNKMKRLMEDKTLRPLKKPDADNIIKVILDSLNGLAYKDDTQVVDLQIRRFYGVDPKVVVTIQEAKPLSKETKEIIRRKRLEHFEELMDYIRRTETSVNVEELFDRVKKEIENESSEVC